MTIATVDASPRIDSKICSLRGSTRGRPEAQPNRVGPGRGCKEMASRSPKSPAPLLVPRPQTAYDIYDLQQTRQKSRSPPEGFVVASLNP